MKVLHVLGKLDRGGVETWLVQVLREIDRSRFQCDVVVHSADRGAYDKEVEGLGIRIIPCLNPRSPIDYARNFLRILHQNGPYDVVHSHVHYFSAYVLLLAATAGVPVRIAHSHTDTRLIDNAASTLRKAYCTVMKRSLPRVATGGFAVSVEAGDALFPARWLDSCRWILSHLGIDLARFNTPLDKAAIRRQLGLTNAGLVVGHVGRIDKNKNQAFIVEVATELLKKVPTAMFLLVGDGPMRSAVEQRVRDLGLTDRFVFARTRSDVPDLLRGAMDVFVFPSILEGLPITLLEAQAAGLRCLVSDVITKEATVVPEMVVPMSLGCSAAEWARAVAQLASLPRPTSVTSCSRMQSRSISISAGALMDIYERFLLNAN